MLRCQKELNKQQIKIKTNIDRLFMYSTYEYDVDNTENQLVCM